VVLLLAVLLTGEFGSIVYPNLMEFTNRLTWEISVESYPPNAIMQDPGLVIARFLEANLYAVQWIGCEDRDSCAKRARG